MRKVFGIGLAAVTALTLASCGDDNDYIAMIQDLQERINDLETETTYVDVTALENQVTDLYETVESAVIGVEVSVTVQQGPQTYTSTSTGSGVIYKQDGDTYYAITNHHVIEGLEVGDSLEVQLSTEDNTVSAVLVGYDEYNDIAIIEFDYTSSELYVVEFADKETVSVGNFVVAIGSPLGFDYYNTLTLGVVSAFRNFDAYSDGVENYVDYIQHDASINSGNSGGPLFNLSGELIGINVLKITATSDGTAVEGMEFAIELADVLYSVYNIEVESGLLTDSYGFDGSAVSSESFDGVQLTTTTSSSFSSGDVIYQVNGYDVSDMDDLLYYLYKYKDSSSIEFSVYTDGSFKLVTA